MGHKIHVAVLGARGQIGRNALYGLVDSHFITHFHTITAIGSKPLDDEELSQLRDKAKANSEGALVDIKTVAVSYDQVQSLTEALVGVDVVCNVNNFPPKDPATEARKQNILSAIKTAGVQMYLPSEFGVDWRTNDFAQLDWKQKLDHQLKARKLGIKVVGMYTGLFTELSFGSWFGWDFAEYVLRPLGDPTARTSYTSMVDVGKAIASVAATFAAKGPQALPDHIRISGTTLSPGDIATLFSNADPQHKEIAIEPRSLEAYEKEMYGDPEKLNTNPAPWIQLIMARGELDLTRLPVDPSFRGRQGEALGAEQITGCNEAVNDGAWEWQDIAAYAQTVKGRPWLEATTVAGMREQLSTLS